MLQLHNQDYPNLETLICSTLRHDPRPVNFGSIERRERFGLKLYHFDIQWQLSETEFYVLSIAERH